MKRDFSPPVLFFIAAEVLTIASFCGLFYLACCTPAEGAAVEHAATVAEPWLRQGCTIVDYVDSHYDLLCNLVEDADKALENIPGATKISVVTTTGTDASPPRTLTHIRVPTQFIALEQRNDAGD